MSQRTIWHYEEFCKEAGQECYPGDAKTVGACLALRASESKSVSMVEKLHGSIGYEHKIRFLTPPTDHASIKLLMKSIRRNFSKPSSSVEPLNWDHLLKMNQHLYSLPIGEDLQVWRTVWRLNMEFYSLCRFSEINSLTTKDVQIVETGHPVVKINIRKSKTDQLQRGEVKNLYTLDTRPMLCPVRLTKKYLARLSKHLPGVTPYVGNLQPRVRKCAKSQFQIPLSETIIGYSASLDETKKLLSELNISGKFGEHSGRRGGATSAAANGASLEEVQKLGGWKSSNCASRYVDKNPEQKERLSRFLYPK